MIYSTQQDRFWDFMSIECRNNRTDAIAMEAMSKEFSGVARTPGDAAELLAHGLHRNRVGSVVATFDRHEVPKAVLLCAVDHLLLLVYWVSWVSGSAGSSAKVGFTGAAECRGCGCGA